MQVSRAEVRGEHKVLIEVDVVAHRGRREGAEEAGDVHGVWAFELEQGLRARPERPVLQEDIRHHVQVGQERRRRSRGFHLAVSGRRHGRVQRRFRNGPARKANHLLTRRHSLLQIGLRQRNRSTTHRHEIRVLSEKVVFRVPNYYYFFSILIIKFCV